MTAHPIRFGTSGWRAIIADEFTFANVRLAVAAIAEHVCSRSQKPTLIVGHDTRFFSEEFARTAAEVLRVHGRSEEHTSELQSRLHLVCRLLLEKKKKTDQCFRNSDDDPTPRLIV